MSKPDHLVVISDNDQSEKRYRNQQQTFRNPDEIWPSVKQLCMNIWSHKIYTLFYLPSSSCPSSFFSSCPSSSSSCPSSSFHLHYQMRRMNPDERINWWLMSNKPAHPVSVSCFILVVLVRGCVCVFLSPGLCLCQPGLSSLCLPCPLLWSLSDSSVWPFQDLWTLWTSDCYSFFGLPDSARLWFVSRSRFKELDFWTFMSVVSGI